MTEPNLYFTTNDFKKWMKLSEQKEGQQQKQNKLVGIQVESKIGTKRLMVNIDPKEGNLHELAKDFKTNGGIINDVDGKIFLIEVNSGFFSIPRYLISKA